jgi:hypothetical protein
LEQRVRSYAHEVLNREGSENKRGSVVFKEIAIQIETLKELVDELDLRSNFLERELKFLNEFH